VYVLPLNKNKTRRKRRALLKISTTFLFQGKWPTRQFMPLGRNLKVQNYRLQLV